jgi:hypothetical protein
MSGAGLSALRSIGMRALGGSVRAIKTNRSIFIRQCEKIRLFGGSVAFIGNNFV